MELKKLCWNCKLYNTFVPIAPYEGTTKIVKNNVGINGLNFSNCIMHYSLFK